MLFFSFFHLYYRNIFLFIPPVGLNAKPMDPAYTSIYPVSSGNGTLLYSLNRDINQTVCHTVFRNASAKVVCLNWGYLP